MNPSCHANCFNQRFLLFLFLVFTAFLSLQNLNKKYRATIFSQTSAFCANYFFIINGVHTFPIFILRADKMFHNRLSHF